MNSAWGVVLCLSGVNGKIVKKYSFQKTCNDHKRIDIIIYNKPNNHKWSYKNECVNGFIWPKMRVALSCPKKFLE